MCDLYMVRGSVKWIYECSISLKGISWLMVESLSISFPNYRIVTKMKTNGVALRSLYLDTAEGVID